jgi:hypothetical protein
MVYAGGDETTLTNLLNLAILVKQRNLQRKNIPRRAWREGLQVKCLSVTGHNFAQMCAICVVTFA